MRLTTEFDKRHRLAMSGIRLAAGIWLLFLFGALVSDGRWWGVALLIPAGVLLIVGTRVLTTR